MSRFVLHYLGDRESTDTSSTRTGAFVKHFQALDDIEEPDRQQFEWMLEHGEPVTNLGSFIYQIRG
ncbi:MAG: hypothetical protein EB116_12030 [Betaproteobacteria bacterium]|nr:hypothetical protein [Betaproteobacteria bacterium]